MRVAEVIAYHVRIPLIKPIRHASHRRTETDNLVIECRLEDGNRGFGEGVPREYVTGETIDGAIDLVRKTDLNRVFGENSCRDFGDAARLAERLTLAEVADDPRRCKGNAARCAVELAFLDAFGRNFGQPVSEVTRILAEDLWQPCDRVQYSGAITTARGFKARTFALTQRLYGFKQCKVKVGMAGMDDVERLRIIRKGAGQKMDLRIDANESWPPGEVAERIRQMEPFGITSVEQPVSHENVRSLTEVRRQVSTPIMHDESLCGMVDAEDALKHQTCDLFNIRLSKCGGFIPSLRLAQFALKHGLGYQLGCQVGETAVLSAAGRHFASSVKAIRYLEGSYDRRLVKESLSTADITFGYGGWAPALKSPGLGIEIDAAALERVTLKRELIWRR